MAAGQEAAPRHAVGLLGATRIETAALEHEPAITIAALDHFIITHLVPDDRMPERAVPTVACHAVFFGNDNFRRLWKWFGGHDSSFPDDSIACYETGK